MGLAANAAAVTLPLGSAQIELAHGWLHRVEKAAPVGAEFGDMVSARHPDGGGVLKLQTYAAPKPVDEEALRQTVDIDQIVRSLTASVP